MRWHALGRTLALWGLIGGIAATVAVAETHEVGTLGATFEGGNWERTQLSASLGKDQFLLVGNETYLVVLEAFALFEERDDFVERIDRFIAGAVSTLEDSEIDPEIEFSRTDGIGRATRRLSGTTSGISVIYQIEMLSAGDGVGYFLFAWTEIGRSGQLSETMESVIEGFHLPADDSDWAAKTQPTVHSYDFDPWTVRLTFPDSVLEPSDSEPKRRYSLDGDEGETAVHIFVDQLDGDIDEILDQIIEVAADDGEYEELLRSEIDSPYGTAQQAFIRLGGTPATDIAIAIIAIEDGQWVDLRLATNQGINRRQGLWNRLLADLQVEKAEPVDAYPIVSPDEEEEDPTLAPRTRAFLEAGQFLVGLPWQANVHHSPGGGLLVNTGERLTLYPSPSDAMAKPSDLYEAKEDFSGSVVSWEGSTLLVPTDGEVLTIQGGIASPAGFGADLVSANGDTLLLARSPQTETLPGVLSIPQLGSTQLILRSGDGSERELAALPHQQVVALGLGSNAALVAAIPRHDPTVSEEARQQLYRIDRKRGEVRPLGPWRTVRRIEPTANGWLVSGQQADGTRGVVRVDDQGNSTPLIEGVYEAVGSSAERLLLLGRNCPDSDEPRCVYDMPRTAVTEYGLHLAPFQVGDLNAIAEQVGASAEPLSREALEARIAAVNAAAQERCGEPLPDTNEGLDKIVADLAYERELTAEAIAVLADLVAWRLVADGGQWMASDHATPARFGDSGWYSPSPFAVALHPLSIVTSTLYDEEGWYQPLTTIAKQTYGRPVLVGDDFAALRQAADQAYPDAFDDMTASGSADMIGAFLSDRSDNLALRGRVYQELASYGRGQVLTRVAENFALAPDADSIDVIAHQAERLNAALKPAEAEEIILVLRDAIEREPDLAGLYHQLGIAYEATERADRTELALAYYEKVTELTSRGSLAESATEAMERLSQETP